MWLAFQAAASVSVPSTVSCDSPRPARYWLTSATTCDASEASVAGQAPAVHAGVAPSAPAAGSAGSAVMAIAVAAATAASARVSDTRRLLGAGGCVMEM